MKVALVYDRVNKWGGAERVLLSLHKLFPTAPLYTSVYNPKKAPWAKVFDVRTSFLQEFPFASSFHELYAFFMPTAFEWFSFDGYDLVISVTSESAKNIVVPRRSVHLSYCLTPTRYLWSGYKEYFKNKWFRLLSWPVIRYLKTLDLQASERPDMMIAISNEVKERIQKYYKRDSRVIYPPLTLSLRGPAARFPHPTSSVDKLPAGARWGSPTSRHPSGYFLVVSRLVPYKRVDIAIRACNELKLPLKIVGTGSEMKKLRHIAGPTVEFLGNLTDTKLVEYYRNCEALLFCGREDFGLSIVEAQGFGKPVIALRAGGALETIQERKTGLFFYPQSSKALVKAIRKFKRKQFNNKAIKQSVKRFSEKIFMKEFDDIVKKALKGKNLI